MNEEKINAYQIFGLSDESESLNYLTEFKGHSLDESNFFKAVKNNDSIIIKSMIESKSIDLNIQNEFGETPLYIASEEGHIDIVKLLLNKGVNLNTQNNH